VRVEERRIAICFDGGRPWHLRAAEELEHRGGLGTFFLDSTALMAHLTAWKSLHAKGHQIGALPLGDLTGTDGGRPSLGAEIFERETELLFEAFAHAELPDPMLITQRSDRCIVFDGDEQEFWQALSSLPAGVRLVTAGQI
jgi:hypothetical protein